MNIILSLFLPFILFVFWARPLPQMGAHFASGMARAIGLAIFLGIMPFGFAYAILACIFPGALVINTEWRYAGNPTVGALMIPLSFSILFLNGLIGEEAGWRGFLVKGMSASYGRGKCIWLSSVLFALWHLPFDLMIAHLDPVNLIVNQGVRLLTGATFAFFFVATGWSLIPVSLLHTTYNFVNYSIVNSNGPIVARLTDLQGLIFVILNLLFTIAVLTIARRLATRWAEWPAMKGAPTNRSESASTPGSS